MNHRPDIPHHTLASSTCAIANALEVYGLDADAVFQEAGMDPARRFETGTRYSLAQVAALWQLGVEKSRDPAFGLTVGRQVEPHFMHALGLAWLASENLLDALERLVRYNHVVTTIVSMSLDRFPTNPVLTIALPRHTALDGLHPVRDCLALAIVRMCREVTDRDFAPLEISLNRPKPRDVQPWRRHFRCEIRFDAPGNRLDFDASTLRRPLPGRNRKLAKAKDEVARAYLDELHQDVICDQVRNRLIKMLPGGKATQDNIAAALHMSSRTLQRRLEERNLTFSRLLDEVRVSLAKEYLKRSDLTVTEIAFMLGYSEPRNFARAFRRWTGECPKNYRHTTPT